MRTLMRSEYSIRVETVCAARILASENSTQGISKLAGWPLIIDKGMKSSKVFHLEDQNQR